MVGRSADADDAVQESFLMAFTRLSELRDPAAFRGWIACIAMNEVRGRLRKRKWLKRLALDRGDDDVSLESLAVSDASPEVRAELAKLDRVLARMAPELRIAWMLRCVEGWELTEVATALDCSLATAKRRIKAAKDIVGTELRLTPGLELSIEVEVGTHLVDLALETAAGPSGLAGAYWGADLALGFEL